MDRLKANVDQVRQKIDQACRRAGRDPLSVTLIVVTKSAPAAVIPRLLEFGVRDIAENRPVEALERIGTLEGFTRHMIGHLQTNKIRKVLEWANVIHSVDRPSLLRELAKEARKPPLFIQVNVSGEATKGGYRPGETREAVLSAGRTHEVRGLMTMAPEVGDPRPWFRKLRELAVASGVAGLSMGMSGDYEIAVEEGATHLRIGSAIFEGVLV